MNFSKTSNFCFISLIMLESLFLISSSFGFQKVSVPEEHKNHIPPLSLIGVIVSEGTSSSVAVLQNKDTGKTVMLTIGESILNLKLTHVLEDGVVLKKGEKIYWIFIGRSIRLNTKEKVQRNLREQGEADRKHNPLTSDRLNSNSSKREFIRSEVQRRIKREWPLIIEGTNVVPNYVDGKMNGFRVVSLPEKSIASEIGIYKDDVIREVNGVKLKDLSTLVWLHSQIFVEDRFEVLIERNKKLIRQVYVLK